MEKKETVQWNTPHPFLSVCMIVRNEEDILEGCLGQVVRFADELIIVDTGSTDRTKEIARKFTDKVYDFVWSNDFAVARNDSFSYAAGDYLMWVDADHIIDDAAVEQLIALKSQLDGVNSVCLQYDSPEALGVPILFHMIMKRDLERRWQGAVHERYPMKKPVLTADITIRHRDRKTDSGPVNLHSLVYRDYICEITDAEIRENFWLGMQCHVDLTFAREPGDAEEKLRLALAQSPPVEELLRTCLLAGNNFLYWGRHADALRMYELFLLETARRQLKPPHSPLLRQLLLKAQKCSYQLGETEKSIGYNEILLALFPDCLSARCNESWFARFAPVTISVCMIVRDEEPVLERCLKNAVQFADELIVVDTGSVDRTREIAARYTSHVYDYLWQDDFAAARNFSYGKATCDYILWLDADDDIEPEGIARIQHLKSHMPPKTDVVLFTYAGDREDGDIFADNELVRDRLIRRDLEPKWEFPIHEAIRLRPEWQLLYRPDIRIVHRKLRVNEQRRNLRIFEKQIAEGFRLNSYNRSYYCRELAADGNYEGAVSEFAHLWQEGDRGDIDYALFFYIDSMKKLKRFSQLRGDLEAYFQRFGPDEMVLCTLGDLCQRQGEFEKAIRWYQMALTLQVDIRDRKLHFPAFREFLPWLGMGKAYLRLGQFAKAEEALKKAERIHPSYTELKILKLYLERNGIL